MAKINRTVNGKKLTKLIAQHGDVQRKVDEVALERAVEAEALLNARAQHRTHTSTISVEKGRIDAYVTLDDTRGFGAAMTIEYGRQADADGKGGMEGLWPLHDAFGLPKE